VPLGATIRVLRKYRVIETSTLFSFTGRLEMSAHERDDVDQAAEKLKDHLKELERRKLIDTAEERWKRDRRDKRGRIRDPHTPESRN
jgi:hypothetical protein